MKMRTWATILGLAWGVVSFAGCRREGGTTYSVTLRNCTDLEFEEAAVRFMGLNDEVGVLPVGSYKVRGFVTAEIPKSAEVSWRPRGGRAKVEIVSVLSALPQDFDHDEIVFQICPDHHVRLRVLPNPAEGFEAGSWRERARKDWNKCLCDQDSANPKEY